MADKVTPTYTLDTACVGPRYAARIQPPAPACDCPLNGAHSSSCSYQVWKERYYYPGSDPTPWCSGCNAMRKVDCKCGPIAENE